MKELKLFREFIDALTQAEGAVSQLIHHSGHPVQFMVIRDALNLTVEGCKKIAPHNKLVSPRTIAVGTKQ